MTATPEAGARKAPLEDLMVAMDVVDTVRHRDLIVDRELNADVRRQRLLARLREIYEAQGIEVTDAALAAGVDALEEDRFRHTPTKTGFSVRLAKFYVRRDRWLKAILGILAVVLLIWLAWHFTVERPAAQSRAELPAKIEATYERIAAVSASDDATEQANMLMREARLALTVDDRPKANQVHDRMESLLRDLETSYTIRVVSRQNERSGVWRVPDINEDARNYYLVVEAVTSTGAVIPIRVRNEEDGRFETRSTWGLRVNQDTFEAVAADKQDDGIIQDNVVGTKQAGQLDPEYRVPTTGATITQW